MIVFGIVACYVGLWAQCTAHYDHVNQYANMESCQMRAKQILDKEPKKLVENPRFKETVVCMDWRGSKKLIVPYLMMLDAYHPKVNA